MGSLTTVLGLLSIATAGLSTPATRPAPISMVSCPDLDGSGESATRSLGVVEVLGDLLSAGGAACGEPAEEESFTREAGQRNKLEAAAVGGSLTASRSGDPAAPGPARTPSCATRCRVVTSSTSCPIPRS